MLSLGEESRVSGIFENVLYGMLLWFISVSNCLSTNSLISLGLALESIGKLIWILAMILITC